jgi:excisionase family DNA binding protein
MSAPTNISPDRRLLDVEGAARYLSIGKRTMQTLLKDGEVPKVRIRSRTLVDPVDLDAYVERIKRQA